jgi:HEAT repeat protein
MTEKDIKRGTKRLRHMEKTGMMLLLALLVSSLSAACVSAGDGESIKTLMDKFYQGDDIQRKDAVNKLKIIEPKTHEDMEQLRKIFSKKDWDPGLYGLAVDAIQRVRDPALDVDLVEILKDETPLMEKVTPTDFAGKTELELKQRGTNVMFIIQKLGNHKAKQAVPILKTYLAIHAFQYYASEALANIGDKSTSAEIRERASRGEEVLYGAQGLDEAIKVVQDLEDKSKKDKWNKLAMQLKPMRVRGVKPYLKRLFDHEVDYVREEAAAAFVNMVDKNDSDYLLEMIKHKDDSVRGSAIHGMMVLRDAKFDDVLIYVLLNDKEWLPRAKAARALGYNKVQKAVPDLEKALRDSEQRASHPAKFGDREELYVCQESYIALYVLTGKKYDFKGKDSVLDRQAERQKDRPSFY